MRGRKRQDPAVSFFAFQDIITAVTGVLVLVTLLLALLVTMAKTEVEASTSQVTAVDAETLSALQVELDRQHNELKTLLASDAIASTNSPEELAEILNNVERELQTLLVARGESQRSVNRKKAELESEQRELTALANRLRLPDLEARATQLQNEIRRLETSSRLIFNFRDIGDKSVWLIDLEPNRIRAAQIGPVEPPIVFSRNPVVETIAWLRTLNARNTHIVLFVRPGALAAHIRLEAVIEILGMSLGIEVIDSNTQVIDPVRGATL